MIPARTLLLYTAAALAEIAGCFAFWMWLRRGGSPAWIAPGLVSLIAFAVLLTRSEAAFAGRAYAAYGGVYIAASVFWMWSLEGIRPNRWDLLGATICALGAGMILLGSRSSQH